MKKFYSLALVAMVSSMTVAQAQTVILEETFTGIKGDNGDAGVGGNDDQWKAVNPPGVVTYGQWTLLKAYAGFNSLKLGTGSAQGIATTPALVGIKNDATLTFRAGAWDSNNEKTNLLLQITGGGTLEVSQVVLEKGAFKTYTVKISNGTDDTKVSFVGEVAANSRFFLDDVKVVTETLGTISYEAAAKSLENTVWTNIASFSSKGKSTVEVYNLNGQLVKSFSVEGKQAVNVSDLTKGIYVVKTTNEGVTLTTKVVKK